MEIALLCCAVIALLLSPLGYAAIRVRAPDCCATWIPAWPFVAGGFLALAVCAWLIFGPASSRFAPFCAIAGHWAAWP